MLEYLSNCYPPWVEKGNHSHLYLCVSYIIWDLNCFLKFIGHTPFWSSEKEHEKWYSLKNTPYGSSAASTLFICNYINSFQQVRSGIVTFAIDLKNNVQLHRTYIPTFQGEIWLPSFFYLRGPEGPMIYRLVLWPWCNALCLVPESIKVPQTSTWPHLKFLTPLSSVISNCFCELTGQFQKCGQNGPKMAYIALFLCF